MKKMIMAVIALVCCTYMFAQKPLICEKNFRVNTYQLSKCLELDMDQREKVELIIDHFHQKQMQSTWYKGEKRKQKKQHAVYENLKLMKDVLSEEQYRKYRQILNVTNLAYLKEEQAVHYDSYLADDQKRTKK